MTKKQKKERGQSLVELALALPLLLLLLIGILKGGIAFNNWITLSEAVRVGGRTLAVSRVDNGLTPNACALATTAIQNAAVNLPQASQLAVPQNGSCTASSAPCVGYTFVGSSTCSNLVAADSATVTANYPCDLTVIWYNFAPNGTCMLTSTITERIE